jgi:hypothetical protein
MPYDRFSGVHTYHTLSLVTTDKGSSLVNKEEEEEALPFAFVITSQTGDGLFHQ